jgi:hypothetical protein
VKELCERQGLIKGVPLTQDPRLSGRINVSRDARPHRRQSARGVADGHFAADARSGAADLVTHWI